MSYYVLIYHLADDYMTRRTQFREEHLNLAKELNEQNKLILGGAFSDPPDKALLIFKVVDKSVIEEFIEKDPYVKNGLISKMGDQTMDGCNWNWLKLHQINSRNTGVNVGKNLIRNCSCPISKLLTGDGSLFHHFPSK